MPFDEILSCLPLEQQKVIKEVMAMYVKIDEETANFGIQSGLRCKTGCGACCENPQIETTLTEVLPMAAHLFATNTAEAKLAEIRLKSSKGVCIFYEPNPQSPGHGRCGIYAFRPGLCRLFGFASRQDKYGQPQLVTCKIIKESQPEAVHDAKQYKAPSLNQHAVDMLDIDATHGHKLLPINEAIGVAIEKIGYALEKFPPKADQPSAEAHG